MVFGQIGQIQRQAGTHHHGVDAGFQGAGDVGGVLTHGTHHVDGQQAFAAGAFARGFDFAVNRLQVGGVDAGFGFIARCEFAGAVHQVGVVAAQVHTGEGADTACSSHATGQAIAGDADAHAALHDGQHAAACDLQCIQAAAGQPIVGFLRQMGHVRLGIGHGVV